MNLNSLPPWLSPILILIVGFFLRRTLIRIESKLDLSVPTPLCEERREVIEDKITSLEGLIKCVKQQIYDHITRNHRQVYKED